MQRIDTEEIIDRPDTPPETIRATLRDQALVNRRLGGGYAAWAHVLPLVWASTADPVRLLDIGCGGGDISRRIINEARRSHKRIEVTAMDLNPNTINIARELSENYPEMTFVQSDALHVPFDSGEFDIVMMTTLLHHFPPDRAVSALREAARLSRGWVVVTDLVRSQVAYMGIALFARLVGFNEVSRHDGMTSVHRAYTPDELNEMADQAGLAGCSIHRHRFYRMALVCRGGAA